MKKQKSMIKTIFALVAAASCRRQRQGKNVAQVFRPVHGYFVTGQKACATLAIALVAGMAVSAQAQYAPEDSQRDRTGIYVRGGGASAWYQTRVKGGPSENRTHNAIGGYLGVGYAFTPMFRLEMENSLLDTSEGSNETTYWYFCKGLGYLDIPLGNCPLTPYVVLGGGYANSGAYGNNNNSTSINGGTLDAGLGFDCAVTDSLSLDFSCRFMCVWWEPVKVAGTTVETTTTGILATLGVRYIF